MQPYFHVAATVAAGFAAGLVNAVAGGGTLISFPVLTLLGLPPLTANITNNVASCAGYLGGSYAQRQDLAKLAQGYKPLSIIGALGGLTGAVLLLASPARLFEVLVPYLIVAACLLLIFQNIVRRAIVSYQSSHASLSGSGQMLGIFLTAVYGGYFGAGLSIMLLSVLALTRSDSLIQLNALKQWLALVICFMSAVVFVVSDHIEWLSAAALAVGFLGGGHTGGRIASKLSAPRLRQVVVIFGLAMAVKYFVALYYVRP